MNICICDDEKKERKVIHENCAKYFRENQLPCEIWEVDNAKAVLDSEKPIDLLILDIQMPEMNGVTLKDHLQYKNEKTMIIFVTSHDELIREAFGINVVGFIGKEWLTVKLPMYLSLAITLLGREILIDGKYSSKNVMRIHSEREYCSLYMKDGGRKLVRGSLKGMEELLQDMDFVRISRSWMVNLHHVEKVSRREVKVQGESMAINRTYWENYDRAYHAFCQKNARYY